MGDGGVGEEWTIAHLVNSSDPVVERWEMEGVGEEWTITHLVNSSDPVVER